MCDIQRKLDIDLNINFPTSLKDLPQYTFGSAKNAIFFNNIFSSNSTTNFSNIYKVFIVLRRGTSLVHVRVSVQSDFILPELQQNLFHRWTALLQFVVIDTVSMLFVRTVSILAAV